MYSHTIFYCTLLYWKESYFNNLDFRDLTFDILSAPLLVAIGKHRGEERSILFAFGNFVASFFNCLKLATASPQNVCFLSMNVLDGYYKAAILGKFADNSMLQSGTVLIYSRLVFKIVGRKKEELTHGIFFFPGKTV